MNNDFKLNLIFYINFVSINLLVKEWIKVKKKQYYGLQGNL